MNSLSEPEKTLIKPSVLHKILPPSHLNMKIFYYIAVALLLPAQEALVKSKVLSRQLAEAAYPIVI